MEQYKRKRSTDIGQVSKVMNRFKYMHADRESLIAEQPSELLPSIMVSGYPRTGTSTMMRMLWMGGLPVLADKAMVNEEGGPASEDSVESWRACPYGSFELYDVAKRLHANPPTWSEGRAFKLVTTYIERIPLDRPIVCIMMVREHAEIIASLLTMRTIWEEDPHESVERGRKALEDIGIPYIQVWYHDMLRYPKATAERVRDFLAPYTTVYMDINAMAEAVDRNARKKGLENAGMDKDPIIHFGDKDVMVPVDRTRNMELFDGTEEPVAYKHGKT